MIRITENVVSDISFSIVLALNFIFSSCFISILKKVFKNKSVRIKHLGKWNPQPPFKFCMQLGTQGDAKKMPFLKVAALLLPR